MCGCLGECGIESGCVKRAGRRGRRPLQLLIGSLREFLFNAATNAFPAGEGGNAQALTDEVDNAESLCVERGDPSASHSLSSSLYAREPGVRAVILVCAEIENLFVYRFRDVPNGRDVEDAVPYNC